MRQQRHRKPGQRFTYAEVFSPAGLTLSATEDPETVTFSVSHRAAAASLPAGRSPFRN